MATPFTAIARSQALKMQILHYVQDDKGQGRIPGSRHSVEWCDLLVHLDRLHLEPLFLFGCAGQ
jgi:hypothetical protein